MQFQSSDWLSHHGIWAIINVLCSPNMVTVCVCSKLKTSWKSVVFTNKAEKNSQYFVGVFKKAIIIIPLCLLLDMRMIIANSAIRTSLAIYHRAVTKSRGARRCSPATMSISPGYFHREQKENRTKRTSFLYNFPSANCIYLATWNFSNSHVPSNNQCALVEYNNWRAVCMSPSCWDLYLFFYSSQNCLNFCMRPLIQ